MNRSIVASLVLFSSIALAQSAPATRPSTPPGGAMIKDDKAMAAPPAGGMDLTKMGPATRKPKSEAAVKKEVTAFFKKLEAAEKARDLDAMLAMHDFPLYMATDDASGNIEAGEYSKEQYTAMMAPFMENMPKDMKVKHKPQVTVLSDNIAVVVDKFTITAGKQRISGSNSGMLVKKNGNWMWKSMVEAGWGGTSGNADGAGGNAGGVTGATGATGHMGATGTAGATGMKK